MNASAFDSDAEEEAETEFEGIDTDLNSFSVSEMDCIRESIEAMSKYNQIEALRLLSKHKDVTLNENKYGVHVNLSELSNEVLNELKNFIQYISAQEKNLQEVEKEKEKYKTTYFANDAMKENL